MGNRQVALGAFFTATLLTSSAAGAATIERLETTHTGKRYTLTFEVVLDAERDRIWRIMTDYEHLPRVSDVIESSRVLDTVDQNHHRVDVRLHACVLIFCKSMKKVVDIVARPENEIVVTGVPALSDFSYSVEHWQVSAEGAQTRLRYSAEMVPDFFIPPVIGPWLVKSFLQREIRATALKVEALARQ